MSQSLFVCVRMRACMWVYKSVRVRVRACSWDSNSFEWENVSYLYMCVCLYIVMYNIYIYSLVFVCKLHTLANLINKHKKRRRKRKEKVTKRERMWNPFPHSRLVFQAICLFVSLTRTFAHTHTHTRAHNLSFPSSGVIPSSFLQLPFVRIHSYKGRKRGT